MSVHITATTSYLHHYTQLLLPLIYFHLEHVVVFVQITGELSLIINITIYYILSQETTAKRFNH